MKEKTILSFIDLLNDIKSSRMTISAYCEHHHLDRQMIYQKMQNIKKNVDQSTDLYNEVATLYNSIVNPMIESKVSPKAKPVVSLKEVKEAVVEATKIDLDDLSACDPTGYEDESRSQLTIIRDYEGRIKEYRVDVPVKDKPNFVATISRDEAEDLHGLYTYYGGNITARNVGKEFLRFSLPEIKKLFRVFGITKDASWAPKHLMEELSVEALATYRMNLKEKAAFKYADSRMERDFNNEIKKLASRINSLEDRNALLASMTANLANIEPVKVTVQNVNNNNILMLHLSDFHIGAKVESGSLYQNSWNAEDVKNRLTEILKKVVTLGNFSKLIINILGDNIDGFDGQTARRDHIMPQCMDNMQQCKTYMNIMTWFIRSLVETGNYASIQIYSVRGGNHDGDISWVLNMALFNQLETMYPELITTKIFDTFFGHYTVNHHDYIICHGKDAKFMKKGMPLNLDDKNKVIIYDWLASQGINGKNVHIVKGDLHTENFNSSYRMDYRNVLSLFGASDYSNYNFTRNQCGISYDMFIGDNLVRGTFEIK